MDTKDNAGERRPRRAMYLVSGQVVMGTPIRREDMDEEEQAFFDGFAPVFDGDAILVLEDVGVFLGGGIVEAGAVVIRRSRVDAVFLPPYSAVPPTPAEHPVE